MPLTGKAQNAKQNMVSVAQNLATLQTAMENAITALQADGASDSVAKVQALKAAMAPYCQAVADAAASYSEADTLDGA